MTHEMTLNESMEISRPTARIKPWRAVTIRVARNEIRDAIRELLADNGIMALTDARWDDIFPHWLIATIDDDVIGCLHVVPSRPFGYLDFLCVKPGVSKSVQAVTVKKLLLTGCGQLRELGADFAVSFVEHRLKSYRNVLKNNGCLLGPSGNAVIKRLN